MCVEAKGKKQTNKSLALGMTVRHISGLTKLINILHGLGHLVSSSTACKYDSALTEINNAFDDIVITRILMLDILQQLCGTITSSTKRL